jgi:DNA mismatch repair protein MutS
MNISTPLRKQYLEIKRRHQDAILLFRIGDFYEAFDEDAKLLARELNIILTSKPMGKDLRVPLAGVPYHSLERHLATLISRGHRVAICEQLTETPTKGEVGRGLIERDVVRIVTPGTVIEPGLLESKSNNYLAAFMTDGKRATIAYTDITTGDFLTTELETIAAAETELQRISPSELLLPISLDWQPPASIGTFVTRRGDMDFESTNARRILLNHFHARTLKPMGIDNRPLSIAACGAIIAYLKSTQPGTVDQLTRLSTYKADAFMVFDAQTLRSLEVFESSGTVPSLLQILDHTSTAMGGRLLRRWLKHPLLDVTEILRRQELITWFITHKDSRAELTSLLHNINDIERLSGRARTAIATPREMIALGKSLEYLSQVRSILQRDIKRFGAILTSLPSCEAPAKLIRDAIPEDLQHHKGKKVVIREKFSEELDRLRTILSEGKSFLAEIEQRERMRTGIKSLRVGYNKVFGYYIEVTRANLHLVPSDYTRKQTLTNAERFITLELKEHETMVVNAQERVAELEETLFRRVCIDVGRSRDEILAAASTLAQLDTLISFAEIAERHNYTRPVVSDSSVLFIKNGRHPVVEQTIPTKNFMPNDISLGVDGTVPQLALVTGPNMSGKSTYLRQTALIVLMAQIGSFVPAEEAHIGICDRIFTRAGLYDRIGHGESTFMTEMIETAEILHHATPRSLILLDELGRGTSTYDGLAVARAVIEYIHNHPQIHSKTLFATHYHELTELEEILPRLKNLHVEVIEKDGELIFTHRIVPGRAAGSYGVYAAKLAGLPNPVVRRAEELLSEYEDNHSTGKIKEEVDISEPISSNVIQKIVQLDIDAISPVEALMKLYELRRLIETEREREVKVFKTA